MSVLSALRLSAVSSRFTAQRPAQNTPPPRSPDGVPELSRGRHRTAGRGACFMEFASFLAGEKWSDHPACTHAALAGLARLVNDWTRDSARPALTPLIPDVIGLVTADGKLDERIELEVAVRAGAAALAIASESRQRALAIGLIRGHNRLVQIDPDGASNTRGVVLEALATVPLADSWARAQLSATRSWTSQSYDFMYGAMVSLAVAGIAEACVTDSDERLRALLASTITACRNILDAASHESAAAAGVFESIPAGMRTAGRQGVLTHA